MLEYIGKAFAQYALEITLLTGAEPLIQNSLVQTHIQLHNKQTGAFSRRRLPAAQTLPLRDLTDNPGPGA
ncbi:MAG: hypothetical protein WBA27_07770 [Pseudomonas neustonica]